MDPIMAAQFILMLLTQTQEVKRIRAWAQKSAAPQK